MKKKFLNWTKKITHNKVYKNSLAKRLKDKGTYYQNAYFCSQFFFMCLGLLNRGNHKWTIFMFQQCVGTRLLFILNVHYLLYLFISSFHHLERQSVCLVSWGLTSPLPTAPCGSWETYSSEGTTQNSTCRTTVLVLPRLPKKFLQNKFFQSQILCLQRQTMFWDYKRLLYRLARLKNTLDG